jgi:uncharacterized ferritin-like protein (DUF455 family)
MSTSIRSFAERLLLGNDIKDKLFSPDVFTDEDRLGISSAPSKPGRPTSVCWSSEGERVVFPKASQFLEEQQRGHALLFFANHELLAIELMALCLLRFPSTPPSFRRGLVNTIKEEQTHFKLYIQRARGLGVQLGDVGVNRFFWDCLSGMKTPFDFITGMAMTFEQANLDHCLHYKALFERVEDHVSAQVMSQIYEDEIRHLRQGLRWFREWKTPEFTDIEAHRKGLSLPLSLSRAKGRSFDVSGRLSAGLGAHYIESLRVSGVSKGRMPSIHLFWPNVEHYVLQPKATPKSQAIKIESDFDMLPVVYCRHGDILLVRAPPDLQHLRLLQRVGITIPQFVEWDGQSWPSSLGTRKIKEFLPWGWDPKIHQICPSNLSQWKGNWGHLFSKAWSTELLKTWTLSHPYSWCTTQDELGVVCESVEEVERAVDKSQHRHMVLKAEYGTAGRDSIRVREGQIDVSQLKWIHRKLKHQKIIVEPWLDRELDMSLQIHVSTDGGVEILGWNRFFTTANGQYLGHWLGAFHRNLTEPLRRWLYAPSRPKGLVPILDEICRFVGEALSKEGYSGPAGIDMLLSRCQETWRLRPIVEINPRQTMGQIALAAGRYVRNNDAVFMLVSNSEFNQLKIQFPHQIESQLTEGILSLSGKKSTRHAILASGVAARYVLKNHFEKNNENIKKTPQ